MTEFDKYMESLITDERKLDLGTTKSEAELQYGRLLKEFHPSKAHLALKKYGSTEAVKHAFIEKKKEHYKKHKRLKGTNLNARNVLYARYADDFLIGIVGPKAFADKIRKTINTFLKGNLHLSIKKDKIINRNEPAIPFLGFLIGLPQVRKKKRIVPAQREAMLRYKRRLIARASSLEIRIGKRSLFALQRALAEAALRVLTPNERAANKHIPRLGQRILAKSRIGELPYSSKSLLLGIKHAKQQLNKSNSISILQLKELIEALPIPARTANNILIGPRILELVEQFKESLDNLQKELDENIYEKKRALLLERRNRALDPEKKEGPRIVSKDQ